MHPDAPYFSILLCLTPDDFTCQVESAATQWVNLQCTQMHIALYFTLSNTRQFYLSKRKFWHSMIKRSI